VRCRPRNINPNQLALDLQELMDAGLVEFVDEPNPGARHYKVTPRRSWRKDRSRRSLRWTFLGPIAAKNVH
jgi:DNA-binding HxlR family transcriptional regulator